MGRKSKEKERKPLTAKTKLWVLEMLPLIQDRPLDELTIDDLAELIGKSKSTIYSYFSTKEEIFQTALQLILDDLKEVVSEKIMEGEDMESVYRSILLIISKGIEGISISFLEQIQLHFPSVWVNIEQFTDKLLANLERVYKKGMSTGDFKTFNIALLTAMDKHFVMSIMTDSTQFRDQGLSLNDLVTEYLELRISALKMK